MKIWITNYYRHNKNFKWTLRRNMNFKKLIMKRNIQVWNSIKH